MDQAIKIGIVVTAYLGAMSLCIVAVMCRGTVSLLTGFIPWWIKKEWWPKVKKFFALVYVEIKVAMLYAVLGIYDFAEVVYWKIDLAISNALGAVLWGAKNAIHAVNHAVSKFEEWLWEVMQYCDEIDRGLR